MTKKKDKKIINPHQFKEGNQMWQMRSKIGRDKLFQTPDELWNACCEYFNYIDTNPLFEIDFKGKDATEVKIPKRRPYTLTGLCLYLDCSTSYFKNFEDNNKDSDVFMSILTRIKEIIRNQKFEGAATGFFNPNLIMRDLGMTDKKEVENSGKVIQIINGQELPDEK